MTDQTHPDLFGGRTRIVSRGSSPYIDRKKRMGFREQSDDPTTTCKYCAHRITINHHNKRYFKCALIGVSQSEATDIRLKNTCNRFAKK